MIAFLKTIGASLLSENQKLQVRKWISARRLKAGSFKKEPEFSILPDIVTQGSVALDIGANLGYYTCELSRLVGNHGKVLAFEPVPEAYARLDYAIGKLGLSNTRIYQIALSDENGESSMTVPIDDRGREVLGLSHLSLNCVEYDAKSYAVRTAKLDDMNVELHGLSFMKCDVEGAELKVLEGAKAAIYKYRPIILVEIENRHLKRYNLSSKDIFVFLEDANYEPYYYDGNKLEPCSDCVEGYNNYLFIPDERILEIGKLVRQ